MPEQNSTPTPRDAGRRDEIALIYRVGYEIIFKYEGNVRARVTGHQLMGEKVWVEARAADIEFLVPVSQVVGVEPKEEE